MVEGKQGKRKMAFLVRIYDIPTLDNLDALMASGNFDSYNALLGKTVQIGAETLLGSMNKAKALADAAAAEAQKDSAAQLAAIEKRVKDAARQSDELFIITSLIQTMVTTLYNVEIAHIHGEEVSAELMDSGYFSDLPEMLQQVYKEMLPKEKKE